MTLINLHVPPRETVKKMFLNTPDSLRVDVAEGGCFEGIFLQQDTSFTLDISLNGPGAKTRIKGGYLSAQNEMLIGCTVHHNADYTESHQTIYGVAALASCAEFRGLIHIPADKKACAGHQMHQGILLDKTARIKATPALEIYAQDVACTHGSQIGALDKQKLFYLKTRGIDEKMARLLLINGFLSHILPQEWDPIVKEFIQTYA